MLGELGVLAAAQNRGVRVDAELHGVILAGPRPTPTTTHSAHHQHAPSSLGNEHGPRSKSLHELRCPRSDGMPGRRGVIMRAG